MQSTIGDAPASAPPLPRSTFATVHYHARKNRTVALRALNLREEDAHSPRAGRLLKVGGREDGPRLSSLVTTAARTHFEMSSLGIDKLFGGKQATRQHVPVLPSVFENESDQRVRVFYKELVIRFSAKTSPARMKQVLDKYGFKVCRTNEAVRTQFVLTQPTVRYAGAELLEVSNRLTQLEEVVFAVPNFVSEFRREAIPAPRKEQWHLRNPPSAEDVRALSAWNGTLGKPAVIVAVLDDGVDLGHPDLRTRLVRNPNSDDPEDKVGRDFYLNDDHPDHYNPRPKNFRAPYDEMDGNDIHGTPCAGVAVADGRAGEKVYGIAPTCRLLPVKVFHGDYLANDSRVGDAIRYAGGCAAVLSCSWSGSDTPAIALALDDVRSYRGGRGALVFVATGNEEDSQIAYPAADPNAIAIGASTDAGKRAWYSNYGAGLSIVAPSNGGARGIFTTDVSIPSRGFNLGTTAAGGKNGRYTNDFGGTSSATPLAAGIGALILSVNDKLTAAEVKAMLEQTARKPSGVAFDAHGFNIEYGHGIVDASAAVTAARATLKKKPAKKRGGGAKKK